MKQAPSGRVAAFARMHGSISEGDDRAARRFQRELRTLGISICRVDRGSTPPAGSPGPITTFGQLVRALDAQDFKAARQHRRLLRVHGYSLFMLAPASARRAAQADQWKDPAAPDRAAGSRFRGQRTATTPPRDRTDRTNTLP
jgi:hypothetical protein